MVWDPARITPSTWPDAVAFFASLQARNHDFEPLWRLTTHLGSQPYASSLACATSGTSLLVARAAPGALPWAGALRADIAFSGAVRIVVPSPRAGSRAIESEPGTVVAVFERAMRDAGLLD